MGNEAAAMAQEAEHANELIHYGAVEWFPGVVINMQTMYMTWISMLIVFVLFYTASRNPQMIPSGLQNALETIIDFLDGLMNQNIGEKGRKYMASFVITLFMFIFISNELGLLPQVGVHWTSPTNDINTCFALSLLIAVSSYVVGVLRQGIGHFKHFISPSPAFLPLHLLDAMVKPLTLALRLFGNILAGEILLIVLYQLSPWVIPELWVIFSLFIGAIQAFIFTILSLGSFTVAFTDHNEH